MKPKEVIDHILATEPHHHGRSRIQAVTCLMESTRIVRWDGNKPVFQKSEEEPQPPPPADLWKWVLSKNPKELPEPHTPKEHQIEQIYLGTRASHYRPLWGFHLSEKSALWKLSKAGLEAWKEELHPALLFWATHPSQTCAEAGYLLVTLNGTSSEHLFETLRENQKFLAALESGKKLSATNTLRALGCDLEAHEGEIPHAAALALQGYKECQGLDKIHEEMEAEKLEIYHALLRSKTKLETLGLSPKLLSRAKKSRKFAMELDQMVDRVNRRHKSSKRGSHRKDRSK